jgi:hypothetical protein
MRRGQTGGCDRMCVALLTTFPTHIQIDTNNNKAKMMEKKKLTLTQNDHNSHCSNDNNNNSNGTVLACNQKFVETEDNLMPLAHISHVMIYLMK